MIEEQGPDRVEQRDPIQVVQIVTTLARGGAQATVLASSGRSRDDDLSDGSTPIEVRVLAGSDGTGEGSFWGDQALDAIRIDTVPHLVRSVRPVADLRALWWLIRWLRAERPDVVHTHSSKAGVLGRLAAAAAGIPCVHTVHGWGPLDAAGAAAGRSVVTVERWLARLSTALVVVGRGDLDRGLALGIGSIPQYRLIRSGVELPEPGDPQTRERVRRELDLEDRWVVGMVARFAAQKDQATLIDAFAGAALTDATLVLVGDGPERAGLQARAAANPMLDVRFLGARPDGARLVAGFDVAVNASRWEGLPRAVVEAAAAGVPVIAADVGSTGDLIEPGRTGRLVPPGDVAALTAALIAARQDRADTDRMAIEAIRRAGAFSADRMRADLRHLWLEVAGHGWPRRPGAGSTNGVTRSRTSRSINQPTTATTAAVTAGRGSPAAGTGRIRTRRWLRTRLPRI